MTAPKAPPREVWIVLSTQGDVSCVRRSEEDACRSATFSAGTVHRYVLAPATERTGEWVVKNTKTGHYWCNAWHDPIRQRSGYRYTEDAARKCVTVKGAPWKALALTRHVRRGP